VSLPRRFKCLPILLRAFNQAKPEKFQAISVGKKTHDKNVMFNLNGINLSCEDEVKLLGVTIDFKLNFNKL
jgi:hypothetical protein